MLKKITPKFIHRIDEYLLTNHPVLWTSKIHFALWHAAVLWVISAFVGFVLPINLSDRIEYGLWYFLFTVPGVILLCFWIYHYLIFNKEKNYGSKKVSDEYLNICLVFVTVTLFLLAPWPFEIVYSNRVADSYDSKELIYDINALNEADPYTGRSVTLFASWQDEASQKQYYNLKKLEKYSGAFYTPYFMRSGSHKYPELLSEEELWKRYKPTTDKAFLMQKAKITIQTAAKYGVTVTGSADEIADRYLKLLAKGNIPSEEAYNYYSYYEGNLSAIFTNVCEAKFKTWFIFDTAYIWAMFYIIFCMTVLLLLFRIVYWRQYLLMLVVLMLYPLITFILSQLLPHDLVVKRGGFFQWSIVLLFLFSIISVFITTNRHSHYSPFYNIFNQVFYVNIIFIPLFTVLMLHEFTNIFHNNSFTPFYNYYYENMDYAYAKTKPVYDEIMNGLYYDYWQEEYRSWVNYTRLGGIVLFIAGAPLLKELFVKQIALPKKS